jgi:quinol monooxygenase YgiN
MIHVLATIQLQPGQRAAFLNEFHQVMPLVHQEQGCIEYGPAIDAPSGIGAQVPIGEDKVVIIEKWDSLDALQAHLSAPHMLEYRQKVKDFVQGTTLQILQPA